MSSPPNRASHFPISLVVPVRDEAETIGLLLSSIDRQTRQPDEIIFVDGGSVDNTIELLQAAASRDERIRIIEAGPATPGRGRNLGIASAHHDWVAMTDAGIRLEPDWLERLTSVVVQEPSVEVVYGNYEPVMNTMFERCAGLSYVSPKRETPAGRMRGPSVASMLMRRTVWTKVRGFPDLRAAEDLIFLELIAAGGFKAGWAPNATVWWQLPKTLAGTFRKFVLYSRHNAEAGRARYWHYGIARTYLLTVPFLILAVAHSVWWLLVPLFLFLLRVVKSIWSNRREQKLLRLFDPLQFLMVLLIRSTIDLSTFIGWMQARGRRAEYYKVPESLGR
jgi:glycosyltransferase involved in cell wall biosynthesis